MRFFLIGFFVLLVGCAGGDPLPRPTGPWEPLNGWQPPPANSDQAAVPQ